MNVSVAIISIFITVVVYMISKKLYRRWKFFFFSPLLISPLVLIAGLLSTHTSYESYSSGSHLLIDLLKPATVAFAIPIYKHFALLRKHTTVLIVSVLLGSLLSFTSSFLIAGLLGLDFSLAELVHPVRYHFHRYEHYRENWRD